MRVPDAAKLIPSAALVFCVSIASSPSAHAATPYCPNRAHQAPKPVPANLVAQVAAALQIDAPMAKGASYVRCVGPTLMACAIGANLVCGKADRRRDSPGATAWCRDNPGAKIVPMAATGHATIYEWSCVDHRAVPGKAVMAVDRHGYIAENWKPVP
jgi:hypothetical protein